MNCRHDPCQHHRQYSFPVADFIMRGNPFAHPSEKQSGCQDKNKTSRKNIRPPVLIKKPYQHRNRKYRSQKI